MKTRTGWTTAGSSPRLRGTYRKRIDLVIKDRFIPAPAGNIVSRTRLTGWGSVHPRACGEHVVGRGGGRAVAGSSPRLRGTFTFAFLLFVGVRFIPAPAGNISTEDCK